jgi:hypothetical protein
MKSTIEKTKQAKRLEDYQPGATRDEVMASLRKVLEMSEHSKKEVDNNGKNNKS